MLGTLAKTALVCGGAAVAVTAGLCGIGALAGWAGSIKPDVKRVTPRPENKGPVAAPLSKNSRRASR